MTEEQNKIPIWFWIAVSFLLIWNLMGVGNFFQHITMTDEALLAMPENERELYNNFPWWVLIAFGLAVFGGSLGSIALFFKKKIAKPLFVISLIGIVVQMGHSLFIANAMDVYGMFAVVLTILLIVLGVFAIWLTNYSVAKNWIN